MHESSRVTLTYTYNDLRTTATKKMIWTIEVNSADCRRENITPYGPVMNDSDKQMPLLYQEILATECFEKLVARETFCS